MNSSSDYKEIPGCPGYSICLVTAQVRNDRTGHILAQRLRQSSHRWYWRVSVGGREYRVHRLVSSAQLGRELRPGEQVRHLDGDGINNGAANLRVGTAAENARDRLLHGTHGIKLRSADVREIRALHGRLGTANLACMYSVSHGTIQAVVARRTWAALA